MKKSRFRSPAHFGAGIAVAAIALTSVGAWAAGGPGPDESTFVSITPVRILDTRSDIGLSGKFVSPVGRDLKVTGQIRTATGNAVVVPVGATGVVLNATAVAPSADGFVSIRPAGTPGAPTTSNLNLEAGSIVPNAVTVALPASGTNAGSIEILFDAYGQAGETDILIDVVGYTTAAGLAELSSKVASLETAVGALSGVDGLADTIAGIESRLAASTVLTAEVSTAGQKVGTGRFTVQRPEVGFYLVTFDIAGLGWSDRQHAQVTSMCPSANPTTLQSNRTATTVTYVVYQSDKEGALTNCAFYLQLRDQQPN